MDLTEPHPTPERAAAALEAAGLNPYLLLRRNEIAETPYKEIGLSVARDRFLLLSAEDVPLPRLLPFQRQELQDLAVGLASRWGLTWRGSIEPGAVQVAFGGEVPYRAGDDPDEAGLRLHDAILAAHHAHQAFRQRAVNAAWRGTAPTLSPQLA